MGNKGWEAAMSLLEMVDLFHVLKAPGKGKVMGVRRRGREYALQMLYAMDLTEYLPDEIFAGSTPSRT